MSECPHNNRKLIPAVLVTDLYFRFTYHPDGDFLGGIDDYFDTAQFLATKSFDVRGIIRDNHIPHTQDGCHVLKKLRTITNPNKKVPFPLGLRYRMRSKEDKAEGEVSLEGVRFLLKQIEQCAKEDQILAIIIVGGLTDLAVALNRISEPEWLKKNVKVYIVAGNADSEETEYNVALDPKAYLRVMTDPHISITWVPCDRVEWKFEAPHKLSNFRNKELVQFLLCELYTYRLYKELMRGQHIGQIDRYELCQKGAPMWSTAALLSAANHDQVEGMPFGVDTQYVKLDDDGRLEEMQNVLFEGSKEMKVLTGIHPNYQEELTTNLVEILTSIGGAPK